ncbi:MAG: UDP-glucose 4-epimerase GalE [Acidobacteria bacterium]|nr:UDP-glucose 4-epimerase GalE [Acidobacteriota bacterium]
MTNTKHVLVTGGAGYIGSVVGAQLIAAGHRVTVLDNLSRGHREALPRSAELVQGDVSDRALLDSVFARRKVDAVVHLAALLEVGESMREPERYFRNNSAGTLTLLEAMRAHGVSRMVFSSTAALFGDPERVPIDETHPLRPCNVYGESKLITERMLKWFHVIHGLRYASLRYFNAAGAAGELGEDHQPESHLIPLVLQVALGQRAKVEIYGTDYASPDGTCVRDYIHVSDLATAHLLALDALEEHGRLLYNLGNGQGYSVRQVIETARRITGHTIPAVETPRRAGDPAVLVASSEKIRRELGWAPKHSELEEIVGSAWEWHRKHPRGYGQN